MRVDEMREAIIHRYSPVVRGKLVADMENHQVVAIYKSMVDRGDSATRKRTIPKKRRIHEPVRYEQLRMEI